MYLVQSLQKIIKRYGALPFACQWHKRNIRPRPKARIRPARNARMQCRQFRFELLVNPQRIRELESPSPSSSAHASKSRISKIVWSTRSGYSCGVLRSRIFPTPALAYAEQLSTGQTPLLPAASLPRRSGGHRTAYISPLSVPNDQAQPNAQ